MQDDGLELDINTVSATLSSCLFGVSMARGAPSSYMFEFQPGHEFILKQSPNGLLKALSLLAEMLDQGSEAKMLLATVLP